MLALLTAEQEMLKETAGRLAASVRLANPGDLDKVDRAKGWASLADAGLLGLRIRDDDGSPGASGVEVMLVAQALGSVLAPLPYVGPAVLSAELLALAGAPSDWLEELVAGEARYSPLLIPDLTRLARVDELPGAIAFDADEARYALALSGDPDAPRVVRVALDDGWAPLDSADMTRVLLQRGDALDGDQFEPAGSPLSTEQLDRWLALGLVAVAADAVGAMRQGMLDVVEYAKQRVQYGVPIGSFQAVQHLCAEMLVKVEGASSALNYGAWAVDELASAEALLAARVAKAYTAMTARSVPETIMQVYGGIGQTWEHIAHFINRRAMLDRHVLGDDTTQLLAITDQRLGSR